MDGKWWVTVVLDFNEGLFFNKAWEAPSPPLERKLETR